MADVMVPEQLGYCAGCEDVYTLEILRSCRVSRSPEDDDPGNVYLCPACLREASTKRRRRRSKPAAAVPKLNGDAALVEAVTTTGAPEMGEESWA